ncbi:MAG TPA: zinc-dependent metalloprotease [Casimicrobiaceae bacterium]|nr:zinc-dependent metalloprotease [Casimicrobiaceae bacterium]
MLDRSRFPASGYPRRQLGAAIAASLICAGCATVQDPKAPETAAAQAAAATAVQASATPAPNQAAPGAAPPASAPTVAAAAAAATAAASAAQSAKPFADVIKDAKEHPGMFTLWTKDDKVWIELKPEQFDKPYFFSVNLSRGLGEKFIFGGLMGTSHVVEFHKIGTNVQLLAKNVEYFASSGKPQERAVAEAFSDSLLAAAPLASQPHPERKSVLVEANALLLADIPGANGLLERTYRQSYSFDPRNSSISKSRATADLDAFEVSAHYSLARVSQPPVVPGSSPYTQPPATIPDTRSLFLGFYYNFAALPEVPMHPRKADDRVGYFTAARYDFADDNKLSPRVNYIRRWRLEKKDPAAELSEPKQPIVFWLDRNIPEKYRPTIIAGVLEWNKAFEKIGFKNAVEARIQPDDADFDTLDVRHASIRWMITARPIFGGIGPSQVDPRTGEILDADIGIDPVRLRNRRYLRVEQISDPSTVPGLPNHPELLCQMAEFAAQELDFALDVLEARGEIEPDSPEAEQFVLDDLKEVVMHEVGHTLGLRHNFRASMIYNQSQLDDPVFTAANGIAGSVMEYNAVNLALKGERQGSYGMKTIGPYDYWAIEYGYRDLPPDQEEDELKRIAARSNEPLLAYATDDDAAFSIDPEVNQGDIGNDPLEFARRRFILVQEMWGRWQSRTLKPGESYVVYRRIVERGLVAMTGATTNVAKYIGGVTTLRDHAGSPRAPLTPIDPARQKAALKIIADGLFSADSFRFKPEFMRRVQVDWLDRNDIYDVGLSTPGVDYSLATQVLNAQRKVLNQLMSESVAQRILDSEVKLDDPRKGLRLADVYETLQVAIWSELRTGRDISPLRRNLQREYVGRVAGALVKPSASMPADARALLRDEAKTLRREIAAAQANGGYSKEARAHLAEMLAQLDEALKAPIIRQGF